MANLFTNVVWEGLSTEPKPTEEQGAADGQFYKELDTGESYFRRDGEWHYINLGLAFVKATKSGRVTTDANGESVVTFTTPFIDSDYTVALSARDEGATVVAMFKNLTLNGFDITSYNSKNGNIQPNAVISWLATRNYNP